MTDPTYCTAQTYRQTRESPAEYCEELVDEPGDLCAWHDEQDRAADAYENWKEARYEG